MVVFHGRRKIVGFELTTISFLIVAACTQTIAEHGRGERLASTLLKSLENSTRYRGIEEYMKNHFQNDTSILHVVIHPKVNPQMVEAVVKGCSGKKSAMILTDGNKTLHNDDTDVTIAKIARVVGIYEVIDDVDPHGLKKFYNSSWNPRSKIAIWVGRSDARNNSMDKQKFVKTLTDFWSIKAINVVILVTPWCVDLTDCDDGAKPRVFGYDPFVPVNHDKRGKLFERSSDDPLFPDKLKNLHGAPIRVSMYHQEPHSVLINNTEMKSGVDVSAIRHVAAVMNFTVKLVTSSTQSLISYTTKLSNNETVGPIGDILNDESDYLANPQYIALALGRKVEFLRSTGRVSKVVIVPRASHMFGLLRLIRGLDRSFALRTSVTLIILIGYFVITKKRYPLFSVFRLVMYQHIHGIGDRNSRRIFLIFWILWAYVISVAVQTQLINDLASAPNWHDIDTIETLSKTRLTLLLDEYEIRSLARSSSPLKNRLAANARIEPNVSRCIEILMDRNNVACSVTRNVLPGIWRNMHRRTEDDASTNDQSSCSNRKIERIHIVNEDLMQYVATIIVQRGFPYLEKFDEAYYRIIENGLIKKWRDQDLAPCWEKVRPPPKLHLAMVEGVMNVMVIGNGIALIVFLAEMLFNRVMRGKRGNSDVHRGRIIVSDRPNRLHRDRMQRLRKLRAIPINALELL